VPSDTECLEHMHGRFNARAMKAALTTLSRDIVGADELEGGHVDGHRHPRRLDAETGKDRRAGRTF
jgi:hypothetical protein